MDLTIGSVAGGGGSNQDVTEMSMSSPTSQGSNEQLPTDQGVAAF